MWSIADIADALEIGLTHKAEQLDKEHAVGGLDSLEELDLHPIIATALLEAGFGVHREQRYPADQIKRKRSEGERCDFVLTQDKLPLAIPSDVPTLFDPPNAIPLSEAYWLEVKVVYQYTQDGPNHNYTSSLLTPGRRDVLKLAKDRGINHRGLLILLFSQDERVAEHDLAQWLHGALNQNLPISSPSLRDIAITDRLGNALCKIALYPLHSYEKSLL